MQMCDVVTLIDIDLWCPTLDSWIARTGNWSTWAYRRGRRAWTSCFLASLTASPWRPTTERRPTTMMTQCPTPLSDTGSRSKVRRRNTHRTWKGNVDKSIRTHRKLEENRGKSYGTQELKTNIYIKKTIQRHARSGKKCIQKYWDTGSGKKPQWHKYYNAKSCENPAKSIGTHENVDKSMA